MNILQVSPPRQNSSRTSNFTLNANQFKANAGSDNVFSNELFLNLKRNYEERVQELENHIKETYNLVESDEIINTMRMNKASEDFCQQRIQELVGESLSSEKELQIEKLSDVNAMLKTDLERIEQENDKIIQAYNEEVQKFNSTIMEYKNALNKEIQEKNQLQQECERLSGAASNFVRQHEEFVKTHNNNESGLQTEVGRLRQEIENLKRQKDDVERVSMRKDEVIDEMRGDIETLKDEFLQQEKVNSEINEEYNNLVRMISNFKEKSVQDESELKKYRDLLERAEEENANLKHEMDRIAAENTELVGRSEFISAQVKKLMENSKEEANKMVEDVREKYLKIVEDQKNKIEELTQTNESLNNEVSSLRNELDENKINSDNIIAQLQHDMRIIKEEWERRCQDIESNYQTELGELHGEHEEAVNRIRVDYENMIQRKLNQVHEDASMEVSRIKSMERESKSQLENRLTRFEKEYILKANHESILASEMLNLRTKHLHEVKELEEKVEKEYAEKLKGIVQNNKQEYETNIANLKGQIKSLEQQISSNKSENQRILDSAMREKERAHKTRVELDNSIHIQKNLQEQLEDMKQNLMRLKGMYDEEVRKNKKKEIDSEDLINKHEALKRKEQDLNESLTGLIREAVIYKDPNNNDILMKSTSLEGQIDVFRATMQASDREKQDIKHKLMRLEEELSSKSQEKQRYKDESVRLLGIVKSLEAKLDEMGDQRARVKEVLRSSYKEVESLKQQLGRLRNACNMEIAQSKEDVQDLLKMMGKELKLKKDRWDLEKEMQNRRLYEEIDKTRDDKEEYERTLGRCERQIGELARELQEAQMEAKEAKNALEEMNKKNKEAEKKMKKSEEEVKKMREDSDKKVEEFRQLQGFVENEMRRLKEESGIVADKAIGRYKQEIHRLMTSINRLKNGRIEKMQLIEEEVGRLQRENERDIGEMKAWYEKKIKEGEKGSEDAKKELYETKRELDRVHNLNKDLKEENRRIIESVEEKLMTVKDMMKHDKEKEKNEKMIEGIEIERLKQSIKDLKVELGLKDDMIRQLNKLVDETGFSEKGKSSLNVGKIVSVGQSQGQAQDDDEWLNLGTKRQKYKEFEQLEELLSKTNDNGRRSYKLEGKAERDLSGSHGHGTGGGRKSAMRTSFRNSEKPVGNNIYDIQGSN